MAEPEENGSKNLEDSPRSLGEEFGYTEGDEEGLYGWSFHRGPLLAALVLTVLFYVFVFLWVD